MQIHASEPDGGILAFLAGQDDIEAARATLAAAASGDALQHPSGHGLHVLAIYGTLPPDEQARVFEGAPVDTRKVVLATNIAETSVTIPGVRYVVDSGVVKARAFSAARGVESLQVRSTSARCTWTLSVATGVTIYMSRRWCRRARRRRGSARAARGARHRASASASIPRPPLRPFPPPPSPRSSAPTSPPWCCSSRPWALRTCWALNFWTRHHAPHCSVPWSYSLRSAPLYASITPRALSLTLLFSRASVVVHAQTRACLSCTKAPYTARCAAGGIRLWSERRTCGCHAGRGWWGHGKGAEDGEAAARATTRGGAARSRRPALRARLRRRRQHGVRRPRARHPATAVRICLSV